MSHALKPLLDRFGNEPRLTVIVFTLDETTYSRELAPLAGHYPALKLGPAWWFFDAPEGMRRFRELTTETAGFYNTVGFNDDTRAYLSIPARHDVARRVDCAYLAELVPSIGWTRTRRTRSPTTSPIGSPRRPTSCDDRVALRQPHKPREETMTTSYHPRTFVGGVAGAPRRAAFGGASFAQLRRPRRR